MVGYSAMRSKKPLLVAGHGIRIANAQEELRQVLNLGIPVVTTFNGFDLVPNNHPCFVGRIGTVGTYGGNYALRNCDLLICVGTRNNFRQISFNYQSFAPQAKKVIVDIDPEELSKPTIKPDIAIKMDAKEFLSCLANSYYEIDKSWLPGLKKYNLSHPIELLGPYKFICDLTNKLNHEHIVVCGNGTACVCMFQAGIVKQGQRVFWNSGCASMGYDLPATIGASFASDREVICVTGDGSLQMNIQELQTIKHYNLMIKIFVLNNGGYHSLMQTQKNYFNSDFIGCDEYSGVSFPDLCNIAGAYGIKYYQYPADKIDDVLRYKGSAICEVIIGNNYEISPKFTNSL